MQPMATLVVSSDQPNTIREIRVIDLVSMQAMALMRQEVERAGFTWLDSNREGHEVCLVKVSAGDNQPIDKPCELRLQRAIGAAGIEMLA